MSAIVIINTSHDLFGDDPGPEVARILRGLADEIDKGAETADIFHPDGQQVGRLEILPHNDKTEVAAATDEDLLGLPGHN